MKNATWKTMTAGALKEFLEDPPDDHLPGRPLVAAAMIDWETRSGTIERGMALCIGENLAHNWLSGDVMVFWDNGDHTLLVGGEIKPSTELSVAVWETKDGLLLNLLDRRVL